MLFWGGVFLNISEVECLNSVDLEPACLKLIKKIDVTSPIDLSLNKTHNVFSLLALSSIKRCCLKKYIDLSL